MDIFYYAAASGEDVGDLFCSLHVVTTAIDCLSKSGLSWARLACGAENNQEEVRGVVRAGLLRATFDLG